MGDPLNADFALAVYAVPEWDEADFELTSTTPPPFLIGFQVAGRIGKEGQADPKGVYGIYQNRMTKRGKVPIKMRFYTPTNPQTEAQQANRAKFADAMAAWSALTSEQKVAYTKRAKRRQMFGWGLFIREYYQQY